MVWYMIQTSSLLYTPYCSTALVGAYLLNSHDLLVDDGSHNRSQLTVSHANSLGSRLVRRYLTAEPVRGVGKQELRPPQAPVASAF